MDQVASAVAQAVQWGFTHDATSGHGASCHDQILYGQSDTLLHRVHLGANNRGKGWDVWVSELKLTTSGPRADIVVLNAGAHVMSNTTPAGERQDVRARAVHQLSQPREGGLDGLIRKQNFDSRFGLRSLIMCSLAFIFKEPTLKYTTPRVGCHRGIPAFVTKLKADRTEKGLRSNCIPHDVNAVRIVVHDANESNGRASRGFREPQHG